MKKYIFKLKQDLSVCDNVNATLLICHKIKVNIILNNLTLFWIVFLNDMRKKSITGLSLMIQIKLYSHLILLNIFTIPAAKHYFYIYVVGRCLNSKWLALHSVNTFFQFMCNTNEFLMLKGYPKYDKSVIFSPSCHSKTYFLQWNTHTHIYIFGIMSVFFQSAASSIVDLLYGQKRFKIS